VVVAVAGVGCVRGDDGAGDKIAVVRREVDRAPGGNGADVVTTRPPTVPQHFVATPNGWFDPACVIEVGENEKVLADGRIARMDGSISREARACASPRYDVRGSIVVDRSAGEIGRDTAVATSTTSTHVEYMASTAPGPVSYFHAQWNVPAAPLELLHSRSNAARPVSPRRRRNNRLGRHDGYELLTFGSVHELDDHLEQAGRERRVAADNGHHGDELGVRCRARGGRPPQLQPAPGELAGDILGVQHPDRAERDPGRDADMGPVHNDADTVVQLQRVDHCEHRERGVGSHVGATGVHARRESPVLPVLTGLRMPRHSDLQCGRHGVGRVHGCH
jgi:hypothetical protein